MKVSFGRVLVTCVLALLPIGSISAEEKPDVAEVRLRAQLLHETIHGALQVMHRDFFKEEERDNIPSASLEDVFAELEKTWKVKVSWMAVNAKPMSVDHKPSDQFQRAAAKAIENGSESHDVVEGETFRYAGLITLGNRCLKCHVPDRTNLEDRKAAVVITMPIHIPPKP